MPNQNDDIIKKILAHAKPDEAMMLEGIKKANATITLLSNELRTCQLRSQELWSYLANVLHVFGGCVLVKDSEKIKLDPISYRITVEPQKDGGHLFRLRRGGERTDTGKDNQSD